jgi:hypothetical protein
MTCGTDAASTKIRAAETSVHGFWKSYRKKMDL